MSQTHQAWIYIRVVEIDVFDADEIFAVGNGGWDEEGDFGPA